MMRANSILTETSLTDQCLKRRHSMQNLQCLPFAAKMDSSYKNGPQESYRQSSFWNTRYAATPCTGIEDDKDSDKSQLKSIKSRTIQKYEKSLEEDWEKLRSSRLLPCKMLLRSTSMQSLSLESEEAVKPKIETTDGQIKMAPFAKELIK